MTHIGKIGRLPHKIREELNRRLLEGEPGTQLVDWLNRLPETQPLLAAEFGGHPINEPNLSAWKNGGYLNWLAQKEALEQLRELAPNALEFAAATDGRLTEHLATLVGARYAAVLLRWDAESSDEARNKMRLLHVLCQDVVQLRRGDLGAARLQLKLKSDGEPEKTRKLS